MLSPTGNEPFQASPKKAGKHPSFAELLLCATLGISVTALLLLLILGIPVKDKIILKENHTYCCPDEASELIRAANFSLNACNNYLKYTCYNWHSLSDERAQKNSFTALFISVTTGSSSSEVGRAISKFYRSCVLTLGRRDHLPARAISALLERTNASRDMTSKDVLRVLMQLSLLYQLYTPVKLSVLEAVKSTVLTLTIPAYRRTVSDPSRSWDDQEALLAAFNKRLGVTVKRQELSRLENKTAVRVTKREEQALNMDLLESLVPNVSKYQWIEMMTEFYVGESPTTMFYADVGALRQQLFVVTSDAVERREAQLALLLVGASVDLLKYNVHKNMADKSANVIRYCGVRTKHLVSLWKILMKELTDPRKDDVVGSLFTATKETVTLDATALLDPLDADKARRLMSAVRLVLPKDIVPHGITIPFTGKGFYSDMLTMWHFDVAMAKSLVAEGGDLHYFSIYKSNQEFPVFRENAVLVPALSYFLLRFDNDTDPAINMAIVGVKLTRIFWNVIFEVKDWTPASNSRIGESVACSKFWTRDNHVEMTLHRLSLRSAIQAVTASKRDWHRLLAVWSLSRLSRAQMFYMKYVNEYCDQKDEYAFQKISALLPSIPDFREAYSCASPVNNSSCFLDS
ncbi:hypothetical protein IscW_ISCW002527 [Ixodes scapularis]|uniref:Uncharacterized protein n=1 Tax=Ixodes scapularis TaxID=6945 RepID=B7PD16_IXOSC|nr:hypothetical protein IscW_ISCW002527 [Ixodes scapularis]|eukprot:XP_002410561.1 hypothetical protein IscW_ISCW002527 [Ixodes scapularis]